jgi:redox-sensitive bicupin YhaK (pirin superfamily)
MQAIPPRVVELGGVTVHRVLPRSARRLVGPWCFLDLVGPRVLGPSDRVDVPPHPHIGLQTVSWLLEGEMRHLDSLGAEAVAHPGTLNLMTAGRGIAHAEETPAGSRGRLHMAQLWVALPDASRNVEPSFEAHRDRPELSLPGGRATVILGDFAGTHASGRTFSPLVAAEVTIDPGAEVALPLAPAFEHAVVPLVGAVETEGQALASHHLYFVEPGRHGIALRAAHPAARVLLIGGEPFGETILMWWNFVARTTDEVVAAREDWQAHRRFGAVAGYRGARLEAPPFEGRAVRANPMS